MGCVSSKKSGKFTPKGDQLPGERPLEDEKPYTKDSVLRGPTKDVPDKTLPQVFRELLNTKGFDGNKAALSYDGHTTSFTELDRQSDCIAKYIINVLGKNDRGTGNIGILLPPSDLRVAVLLGILKANYAFLPLDLVIPDNRMHQILSQAKPKAVITSEEDQDILDNLDDVCPVVVCCEDIELSEKEEAANGKTELPSSPAKNPIAAIYYTSGSTGTIKGVPLSHRNVLNRLMWQWTTLPFSQYDVTCHKTPLLFIDSLSEIFGAVLKGTMLTIPNNATVKDTTKFMDYLDANKVSRVLVVPSQLKALFAKLGQNRDNKLKSLATVVCSGEELPPDLVREFFKYLPGNRRLINLYGSTEVTGDVTYEVYTKPQEVAQRTSENHIAVGKPVWNTGLYVMNEKGEPVPAGETGELYISGMCVCDQYVDGKDPEKFTDNKRSQTNTDAVLFKTGDYVSIQDGRVIFKGRADSMVKVLGQRFFMSEVDHNVQTIPEVKDSMTIVAVRPNGHAEMVTFYETDSKHVADVEADMMDACDDNLPSYVRPTPFRVEKMPHLPGSGKVDRDELQKIYADHHKDSTPIISPDDVMVAAEEVAVSAVAPGTTSAPAQEKPKLAGILKNKSDALRGAFDTKVAEADKTIEDTTGEADKMVKDTVADADNKIKSTAAEVDKKVDDTAVKAEAEVNTVAAGVDQKVDETVDAAKEEVGKAESEIDDAFARFTSKAKETVDDAKAEVGMEPEVKKSMDLSELGDSFEKTVAEVAALRKQGYDIQLVPGSATEGAVPLSERYVISRIDKDTDDETLRAIAFIHAKGHELESPIVKEGNTDDELYDFFITNVKASVYDKNTWYVTDKDVNKIVASCICMNVAREKIPVSGMEETLALIDHQGEPLVAHVTSLGGQWLCKFDVTADPTLSHIERLYLVDILEKEVAKDALADGYDGIFTLNMNKNAKNLAIIFGYEAFSEVTARDCEIDGKRPWAALPEDETVQACFRRLEDEGESSKVNEMVSDAKDKFDNKIEEVKSSMAAETTEAGAFIAKCFNDDDKDHVTKTTDEVRDFFRDGFTDKNDNIDGKEDDDTLEIDPVASLARELKFEESKENIREDGEAKAEACRAAVVRVEHAHANDLKDLRDEFNKMVDDDPGKDLREDFDKIAAEDSVKDLREDFEKMVADNSFNEDQKSSPSKDDDVTVGVSVQAHGNGDVKLKPEAKGFI